MTPLTQPIRGSSRSRTSWAVAGLMFQVVTIAWARSVGLRPSVLRWSYPT
jgi:hypothetical protein